MSEKDRDYEDFLKHVENNYLVDTPAVPDRPRISSKERMIQRKKAAKKRKIRRIISVSLLVIIILALILVIVKSCSRRVDKLYGTWSLDGVTVYQFDGKGNGSLKLPEKSYPFTYKIKKDNLIIKFDSESAQDVTYTFAVENGKLLFVRSVESSEKNDKVTYELTKKENGK